ncbi:MAG TPA: TonB-dependent receptor, partial [Chryseosolibacter sp.]|nr:TonB-dependent receptor [Chryseosolibacter sp.]
EQPVWKDKASLWVAARRTYVDQVLKVVDENLPYYFHDMNAKLILRPSESDRIEIGHYGGEDVLDLFKDKNNDGQGMLTQYNSGSMTQSLKWNHANPNGWRNNLSLFRTNFKYRIKNSFEDYSVSAFSEIEDYGVKLNLSKDSVWTNGTFTTGCEWTRHAISPKVINSRGSISETVKSGSSEGEIANEFAMFVQQEWALGSKWLLNAGVRGSVALVDGKEYIFPEPRISARYNLSDSRAIKFNYSRMVQYMHRISNSGVSTPTDVWYPVTERIRPQTSHQFSVAWQRFLPWKKMFFSVETYYKAMEDLIAYKEGTNLLLSAEFASRLLQGNGRSYGTELLIRKEKGRFTGWISYTLSWSFRQFDEINQGEWFHARYDRRHNGAIVAQYTFARRWAASMIWEYISGARFTPVVGQYVIGAPTLAGVDLVPVFSKINAVKLSDTHRLDLGLKFFNDPSRKFKWTCFVGVYNAYNRASPIGIVIEEQENGKMRYMQPGLFGLLPFASYGIKF